MSEARDKIETKEINVNWISPKEISPHPKNLEIYEDQEDKLFDEDIQKNGIRKPLVINSKHEILDGVRRWKRANRFGIEKVPAIQNDCSNEVETIVMLNRYRKKTAREEYNEIKVLREKHSTEVKPRGRPTKNDSLENHFSNNKQRTLEKIADNMDRAPSYVFALEKVYENVEKIPEVVEKLDKSEITVKQAYNELQKVEKPKSQKPFKPSVFTVWNYSKCDERFGVPDFPGRIPGQIVQNVLHYYSNENDFVVDPMAGSGTTFDVCESMNRRCLAFDIEPIRKEILKHDIRQGFPDQAKNCDLIFLDPPYFKKLEKEERYNHHYIKNRDEWFGFIAKLAKDCHEALHPKSIVTLLISDYIDDENSILTCEYYNIFVAAGFKPINRIQVPLTTQQYKKPDVAKARENKTLLNVTRDLFIFKKV